ncbi:MAG: amidophosphoribosyltransferase [Deltaproteobacteria bacterium]|nr:amidophosphoribosyltransferase [Deltaproteobacteria bacterium]
MCGIAGVFGHPEAAKLTYLALHALQHRGQESAGIVSSDGTRLYGHRAMGHVAEAFSEERLTKLPGDSALGHVRYSTAGDSSLRNCGPFWVDHALGPIAVAHNGNLTNAETLRRTLEEEGAIFQSTTDSEAFLHLIARSREVTTVERIREALKRVEGAYSLIFLTDRFLVAARDPYGFRPLVLGRLRDAWVVASETCAFDLIEATFEREVAPGEIVVIDANGVRSLQSQPAREARCVFEHIYFSRPDSVVFGKNVYTVRNQLGRELAREQPAKADVVVPVPDSGVPAAIGYAAELGLPFEMGLIRSHYVGRTFIEPSQSIRHFGVKLKLNAARSVIEGKRIVVVDDSIVRGTTSRKIVKMIRQAGATEVHLRISAPPTTGPCFYGIDTPTKRELIASSHSVDEIRDYLGVDTLGYLSLDGVLRAAGAADGRGFCHACFSGDYPVGVRAQGGG